MKVHIVSYNLDQKKFSKSKIHILPNYEQTNLKTAIVQAWKTILNQLELFETCLLIEISAKKLMYFIFPNLGPPKYLH